ncbi:NUDIX domain-containing protein [Streptomyces sp. NPDC049954]|uniref:NUDIX hydrolase n=1 Tax=Streptomyces sp. NPDC049954 TaxID=3155779 RepID=UPI0034318C61
MERKSRRTSRVLLIDERERLLLLCGRDPRRPGARWWFTVGGGLEGAEDYPRAAVREIQEETALGLPVTRLSPPVWTRQTVFSVDGQGFDQYEEYRLVRVTREEVDTVRIDPAEARYGHRWWTVGELATTAETVRPRHLAAHLADLLETGGPGPRPLHLGDFDEDTDPDE